MQTLDVISVNLWQIVISLLNLVVLYLIAKHFLYKPVKRIIAKRNEEIEAQYTAAKNAEDEAYASRDAWEKRLAGANDEADAIIKNATDNAKFRGEQIVADAKAEAESIVRVAQNEAELEYKKAADGIKREIVVVSGALTEKLLQCEINTADHKALIDSFIDNIGDNNE
ncbi:MAG: F0F1 ATP synthase subunit B [Clostridia bacterium]|nr:F0F1 ATP synthase subunit B [Clostridia bacterium]